MNLATLIAKRAEEGRPIRVGMIGAGKFGTMLEETTFVNGEGEEVQRRFVFTESLDILLEFIIQGRDLDSDKVKVNVEQDSGQQRMLVVLQIGDEIEKTVKDTSTKRGIIIAFVDDIPENYRNPPKTLPKPPQSLAKASQNLPKATMERAARSK